MAKQTKTMRRKFDSGLKARVALEALREQKTTSQIASIHSCHTSQVAKWKKTAVSGLPGLFSSASDTAGLDEKLVSELYEQIGRLKMELEWFKKKSGGFA
jgi:transposase